MKEFSRWALPANSCLAATSSKMSLPSRHRGNDHTDTDATPTCDAVFMKGALMLQLSSLAGLVSGKHSI